ncbi:hypothetical protein VM1G_11194 [Cytospora mali]|uniref:Uncharacterized protein n=1 Tax=Cytospora mali TaxID=578113 RepID=A0A194VK69_CYTMA|nr:hypothetical protein VM1G_11194 [Valsa mali]
MSTTGSDAQGSLRQTKRDPRTTPVRLPLPSSSPVPPSMPSGGSLLAASTTSNSKQSSLCPESCFDLEPSMSGVEDHLAIQPMEETISGLSPGGYDISFDFEEISASFPNVPSPSFPGRATNTVLPLEVKTSDKDPPELVREPDDTAQNIRELSDLNLRIYEMALTAKMPVACEEMTNVTRCLLKILGRVLVVHKQRLHGKGLPSPPSLSQNIEDRLQRHSIESVVYPNDGPGSTSTSDTATILMILACYQRLFDLFKQTCILLHTHIARPTVPEISGFPYTQGTAQQQTSEGHSAMWDDGDEKDYSTAQVIMTTELTSHLLSRLDRGIQQLVAALGSEYISTPTLPSPPLHNMVTAQSSSETFGEQYLIGVSPNSVETTKNAVWTQSDTCLQGTKSVIDAMARRQQSLHAHIRMIKQSVRASDIV